MAAPSPPRGVDAPPLAELMPMFPDLVITPEELAHVTVRSTRNPPWRRRATRRGGKRIAPPFAIIHPSRPVPSLPTLNPSRHPLPAQDNVHEFMVMCLPEAYVRAIPGLVPNVSGDSSETSPPPEAILASPPGTPPPTRKPAASVPEHAPSPPPPPPLRVDDDVDVDDTANESGGGGGAERRGKKTLWIGRARELGAELRRLAAKVGATTTTTTTTTGETGESEPEPEPGLGMEAFHAIAALDDAVSVHGDAKPAVFFLAGSGGVAGDSLRYLRVFASLGHVAMSPDDFAGWPTRLRSRPPRSVSRDEPNGYWEQNLLYAAKTPASGTLVYQSCAEQFASSDRLALVYDTTLKVKHAALTSLLTQLPERVASRGIFLAGNSEGAVVLGMMDDKSWRPDDREDDDRDALLGRVNIAYSLEPNYFTYHTLKRVRTGESDLSFPGTPSSRSLAGMAGGGSSRGDLELSGGGGGGDGDDDASAASAAGDSCASLATTATDEDVSSHGGRSARCSENDGGGGGATTTTTASQRNNEANAATGVFGSRWRRDIPTLCVNGSEDQFFGRRGSVSENVVRLLSRDASNRPHITGDAGQRIAELGMNVALVAQMEGARHAMLSTHDALLRELLRDFLSSPRSCVTLPERWTAHETMADALLWHSIITPGKVSFASVASAATMAARARGREKGAEKGERGSRGSRSPKSGGGGGGGGAFAGLARRFGRRDSEPSISVAAERSASGGGGGGSRAMFEAPVVAGSGAREHGRYSLDSAERIRIGAGIADAGGTLSPIGSEGGSARTSVSEASVRVSLDEPRSRTPIAVEGGVAAVAEIAAEEAAAPPPPPPPEPKKGFLDKMMKSLNIK